MRCVSALVMVAGIGLAAALPVSARDLGGEATGNWAGAAGAGFFFRAALDVNADLAALRIWNGTDAVPGRDAEPDLDVPDFGVAAFATVLRLDVVETGDGSILQVITEFADEEAEGTEVVELQYRDSQFTIIGYSSEMTLYSFDGPEEHFACEVDLQAGTVVNNGEARSLPPLDAEALNASLWKEGAAFERGWCSTVGEG